MMAPAWPSSGYSQPRGFVKSHGALFGLEHDALVCHTARLLSRGSNTIGALASKLAHSDTYRQTHTHTHTETQNTEAQRHRNTDRHTDRHTDKHTNRHANRHTERQTNKQTHKHRQTDTQTQTQTHTHTHHTHKHTFVLCYEGPCNVHPKVFSPGFQYAGFAQCCVEHKPSQDQ